MEEKETLCLWVIAISTPQAELDLAEKGILPEYLGRQSLRNVPGFTTEMGIMLILHLGSQYQALWPLANI